MAKEDKNEALHSEKDGRFVSEDFSDMSVSELLDRQRFLQMRRETVGRCFSNRNAQN
ncbi:MAG: hypothetical protein IJW83_03965 [Clostridia bacterium]|nr:hypothetical protein [Clostridia bacterium]